LLDQDEEISVLDQLRERISKKEAELRKQREENKKEENELQRIRKEIFRATKIIYIELFASRPPPVFQESNTNFGEERNVENEIFEALKHVVTMGEELEETL
jgi:hypothetical protein